MKNFNNLDNIIADKKISNAVNILLFYGITDDSFELILEIPKRVEMREILMKSNCFEFFSVA